MRAYSIDSEILTLFESKVPRGQRSKFVRDSMAAAAGIDAQETEGIPVEKLLEQKVRELTLKLEDAAAELAKIKEEQDQLIAKYNRVARRKTSSFSLMAPVPRNSEPAAPSSKASGQ
jgi:glutamine synthetase type III